MYHCHMCFYWIGRRREPLELIQAIQPLEPFTHEFWESADIEPGKLSGADVVLADLRDLDAARITAELLAEKVPELLP